MKNHKIVAQIDDDILAEIIGKCEGKMVSPFKKAKPEIEVEPEEIEDSEDESPEVADKLEGVDLEDLLEMYRNLKD